MEYAPFIIDALDKVRDYLLYLYTVKRKTKKDKWNHAHLTQSLEVVLGLAFKQYNQNKKET